jgi:hypothetical protein
MTNSVTRGSVPNVRRAINAGDVRRAEVQRRIQGMRAGSEGTRIEGLIKHGLRGRR